MVVYISFTEISIGANRRKLVPNEKWVCTSLSTFHFYVSWFRIDYKELGSIIACFFATCSGTNVLMERTHKFQADVCDADPALFENN